jgi:hypothetical protein
VATTAATAPPPHTHLPTKSKPPGPFQAEGGMIIDIVYDPGCYTTRNNKFTYSPDKPTRFVN